MCSQSLLNVVDDNVSKEKCIEEKKTGKCNGLLLWDFTEKHVSFSELTIRKNRSNILN